MVRDMFEHWEAQEEWQCVGLPRSSFDTISIATEWPSSAEDIIAKGESLGYSKHALGCFRTALQVRQEKQTMRWTH